MVRSTKAPKKRTSATKRKTNKVSATPASLRNPRVLLFALVFAAVGVFALLQIGASPALPEFSDDIVAGYLNLTPTLVSQDEAGNRAYEMYPATTYVQADGTVVCDSGGTIGTVTTGTLSKGEVKKLQKDILDTGVTDLADEIGTSGQEDAFVTMEGFMVAEGTDAKGTAVYPGGNKPSSFEKAQATLQRACDKAARTTERSEVKAPREPKLKKSNNRKTAFSGVSELLFPKVSACCGGGTRDTNFESQHVASINNYRAQNGRARLPVSGCLTDKALYWSDAMAKAGKISHSPNIASDTQACHPTWNLAGENVGVGYDNAGLMKAFIASAPHRANMLDTRWRAFGVGAVRKSDNRVFVTQRYARY